MKNEKREEERKRERARDGRDGREWTGVLLVFMEFHAFGLLLIRRDASKKLAVLDCGFRDEVFAAFERANIFQFVGDLI